MLRLRPCAPVLRRFGLLGAAPWWRPSPPTTIRKRLLGATAAAPTLLFLFSALVFVAFFRTLNNVNESNFRAIDPTNRTVISPGQSPQNIEHRPRLEFPLKCKSHGNITSITCPKRYYPATFEPEYDELRQEPVTCPDYFRWIHEDLKPWRESGIERDMVERARPTAHFRLVIVNGRAYVEKYKKSIQTRDLFTMWGILQLLRRYPGRVPDLELMFDCNDRPVIRSRDYRGANSTSPPPLFRYCGDRWTMDIVFPDWSFWGWAEINIRPWEKLLQELKEGNGRTKWSEREPFAYWKGNPYVAETRRDLLRCNVSELHDWKARLFIQDWILESHQGYKHSGLADQCTHRYKIYIEGYAWSVSEKYILACDSVTLLVKPHYYDFFTRSLAPLHHYWPVRDYDKCRSIEFAVEWGNTHPREAEAMGRAAAAFLQEQVKMDDVYDYMFHLLNEYSKLMRFEPRVPQGAVEICAESLGCSATEGPEREFMMESLVQGPSVTGPCRLPPPFEPKEFGTLWRKSISATRRVERWENGYREGIQKKKNQ